MAKGVNEPSLNKMKEESSSGCIKLIYSNKLARLYNKIFKLGKINDK